MPTCALETRCGRAALQEDPQAQTVLHLSPDPGVGILQWIPVLLGCVSEGRGLLVAGGLSCIFVTMGDRCQAATDPVFPRLAKSEAHFHPLCRSVRKSISACLPHFR